MGNLTSLSKMNGIAIFPPGPDGKWATYPGLLFFPGYHASAKKYQLFFIDRIDIRQGFSCINAVDARLANQIPALLHPANEHPAANPSHFVVFWEFYIIT